MYTNEKFLNIILLVYKHKYLSQLNTMKACAIMKQLHVYVVQSA